VADLRSLGLFGPRPDATRVGSLFPEPERPRDTIGPVAPGSAPDPDLGTLTRSLRKQGDIAMDNVFGLADLARLIPTAVRAMGQGREGDEARETLMGVGSQLSGAIMQKFAEFQEDIGQQGFGNFVSDRVKRDPFELQRIMAEMVPFGPKGRVPKPKSPSILKGTILDKRLSRTERLESAARAQRTREFEE